MNKSVFLGAATVAALVAGAASAQTLDQVRERGELRCGVSTGLVGFAFVDGDGNATRADYTFAYHKLNGRVLISLHHSSLTWFPPVEE